MVLEPRILDLGNNLEQAAARGREHFAYQFAAKPRRSPDHFAVLDGAVEPVERFRRHDTGRIVNRCVSAVAITKIGLQIDPWRLATLEMQPEGCQGPDVIVLQRKAVAFDEPVAVADPLPGDLALEARDRNRPSKELFRIDRGVPGPEPQAPRIIAGRYVDTVVLELGNPVGTIGTEVVKSATEFPLDGTLHAQVQERTPELPPQTGFEQVIDKLGFRRMHGERMHELLDVEHIGADKELRQGLLVGKTSQCDTDSTGWPRPESVADDWLVDIESPAGCFTQPAEVSTQ